MSIYFKEVIEKRIGQSTERTFLIKISQCFVTISAFTTAINELEKERPMLYKPIIASLAQLRAALTSIADIPEETLSEEELKNIKKNIRIASDCELYATVPTTLEPNYYDMYEYITIAERRLREAHYPQEQAMYSNIITKTKMVKKIIEQINNALKEQKITPEEQQKRGYLLSEAQIIKENVEVLSFFVRKTLDWSYISISKNLYYVPGMNIEYQELEVDKNTGAIFWPQKKTYEGDVTKLYYIYATPDPHRAVEVKVSCPSGYNVLSLEISIPEENLLSPQAKRVVTETEAELFAPCLEEIELTLKNTSNKQIVNKLSKIVELLKKYTE